MNNIVVFSEQALYYYILESEIMSIKNESKTTKNCIRVEINNTIYYFSLSQKDRNVNNGTLIIFKNIDELFLYPEHLLRELFERIHKFAHEVDNKRRKIPHDWHSFHHKNKVCFFAFNMINEDDSRVVIEICGEMPNNLMVHGLIQNKNVLFDDYVYSEIEYKTALSNLTNAIKSFNSKCEDQKIDEMGNNLYFENIITNEDNYFSYDEWIKRISKVQAKFVNSSENAAIKLRGPAGTGKTLAMKLKAVKLLRNNTMCRILFLTHSWTVADHVQYFIEQIAQSNDELIRIDVFPLLFFAESFNRLV
jgi:hypothetical protein